MAHFRATIQGNRGQASRLGSADSGITAQVNGWQHGVSVYATHVDGLDIIRIYRTPGSGHTLPSRHVATVYSDGRIDAISEYGRVMIVEPSGS